MALTNIRTTAQSLVDTWQSYLENGDPKTADWPLVASPWPTVSFVAAYLFIVKVGPKIMEKRKAYDLREVLIVYNFALVLLSAWMAYELVASAMDIPNFNYLCQSVPYVRGDEKQNRLARAVYIYWLSKFVEALETIFFILRKKNSQVSFLHVYHHTTMFIVGWAVAKWLPGGVTFFGGACNSFVHVVMYAYYGLSAIGPQMRPYLWWKRYITRIQLIQFLILLIYMANALRMNCFGGFPEAMTVYFTAAFTFVLAFLFGNFYIQAYLKKNEASPHNSKKAK
ncbi:elongation of very long chain fatty acids protein 4-like isoform X1 [Acropora millepora]|uniref:elongation of very long chain fatty acids protein 4-like isoform X1 n=2 Tax=Acropora TaxID=6127 RepID=UPI001CF57306|nr:elongation of very long chain fatty acids protein 4-like isoform X1 [Acropora millepora]